MKHQNEILRSMPEGQSAAADGDDDKRKAIAVREWIKPDGSKVVAGSEEATGFRYTYKASGQSVDYQCGDAGKLATMFAIMGGLTKVGNIVNSIVNADDYNGTDDPMASVKEWLELAEQGKWREAAEAGARGPKYDKDVLAGALLAVLTAQGIAKGDLHSYRERLEDKSYYAKVRGRTDVMAQYYKDLAAKGGETAPANLDSLA